MYLRPRDNPLLQVTHFELSFSPDAKINWMRDNFDNLPASVQFLYLTKLLENRSKCSVITTGLPPFDFLVKDYAMRFSFTYESLHHFNLSIYLKLSSEEV